MIIAIPYLEGEVNTHFGSTKAFLVAETVEGRVQKSMAGSGGKIRSYQGIRLVVQVVIAAYVLLISIGHAPTAILGRREW